MQGRVAWEGGRAGHPAKEGATRPHRQQQTREGKRKAKSRKLASLRLTSHHLALLSRTPNHHCWGCCITCFCFFSFPLPCDLSTLHPTEHSIQVFLARFPFDRPLSSSIWCQRRSKYRSQTRRPKQGYRGELRVRAVCADRTM